MFNHRNVSADHVNRDGTPGVKTFIRIRSFFIVHRFMFRLTVAFCFDNLQLLASIVLNAAEP